MGILPKPPFTRLPSYYMLTIPLFGTCFVDYFRSSCSRSAAHFCNRRVQSWPKASTSHISYAVTLAILHQPNQIFHASNPSTPSILS